MSSTEDEIDDPQLAAEIEQQRRKIFFTAWQRHARELGNYWLILGLLGVGVYGGIWLARNWPFAEGIPFAWNRKLISFLLLIGLSACGLLIRARFVWPMFVALLIGVLLLANAQFTVLQIFGSLGMLSVGGLFTYQALRTARVLRQHNVPLRY